jgi:cytochrome oxidase Cu insertion factor (SCO1/SenC/PrrC family)|tara:strand:- start:2467 stop:2691 length:225 start_codon:yes stop_codon:yes gene_type:complete
MIRSSLLLVTMLGYMVMPTFAQPGNGPRSRGGGGQLPQTGTLLPTVTAVDEQGQHFSTATLRGSYTVLVFGCLT